MKDHKINTLQCENCTLQKKADNCIQCAKQAIADRDEAKKRLISEQKSKAAVAKWQRHYEKKSEGLGKLLDEANATLTTRSLDLAATREQLDRRKKELAVLEKELRLTRQYRDRLIAENMRKLSALTQVLTKTRELDQQARRSRWLGKMIHVRWVEAIRLLTIELSGIVATGAREGSDG